MRSRFPLRSALAGCALVGCSFEERNVPGAVPDFHVVRTVDPPPGYTGPIDPEWPPQKTTNLAVEIAASRVLRERLTSTPQGSRSKVPEGHPGYHVEAGTIGSFSYLEVIIGVPAHPDQPLPLVVLLHGRGNRPHIPEGPLEGPIPFRMFIPQAPDALGDGFTWLAAPTLSSDEQLFTRSLAGRVDQLAPAIEAYRQLRPTLGKPILVGFSQGGIMTFALAARHPSLFSAAFPIAGWLPPELYPPPSSGERYPYVFAQHGGSDAIVPTERGRATVAALRARGLSVDYLEIPGVPHMVSPEMSERVRRAVRRVLRTYKGRVRGRGRVSAGLT